MALEPVNSKLEEWCKLNQLNRQWHPGSQNNLMEIKIHKSIIKIITIIIISKDKISPLSLPHATPSKNPRDVATTRALLFGILQDQFTKPQGLI